MRTQRQDYKDSAYMDARRLGSDTLQLKYDGWWVRIEITNGQGRLFTQTNREVERFQFQLTQEPMNAVVVGELMHGTQWSQDPNRLGKVFLFDCWQVDDTPLETLPYKTRYAVLKTIQKRLPRNYELVPNFRVDDYDKVWKEFVETELFEGVVFRDSRATVGTPVLRHKNTIADDAIVVGFQEGEGKHEGRLGALLCRIGDQPQDVGGGFDDDQREEIWTHKDDYLGRYCQIEGKARFNSGALRHPNFVAWRPPGWTP